MIQPHLAALLLSLVSCAPPYTSTPGYDGGVCTTPCGAIVTGTTEHKCTQLARYEALSVEVLSPLLNDPKRYSVCLRLRGWAVTIMDTKGTGSWVDAWGRTVGGLTFPEYALIELGTDIWEESAFAHESVHAWHFPDGDPTHLNWDALGYYKAFDEINRRYKADTGQ